MNISLAVSALLLPVPSAAPAQDLLFQSPQFPSGGLTQVVETGDWNNDGILDLVSGLESEPRISLALGVGNGSFGPPIEFVSAIQNSGLALGDLNGDGQLDAAIADRDFGTVRLLFGDGNQGLVPNSSQSLDAGEAAFDVRIADLDGDGLVDLTVAVELSGGGGGLMVLRGVAPGSFAPGTSFATPGLPSHVTLADVDGDGSLDAITAEADAGPSILYGDGSGNFGPAEQPAPTLQTQTPVSAADLNADGLVDLVAIGTANGLPVARTFLQNLQGGFSTIDTSLPVEVTDGELADIDSDGLLDLITCDRVTTSTDEPWIRVAAGDGTGSFNASFEVPGSYVMLDVDVVDIELDGDLDLVAANQSLITNSVFLADAPGQFSIGIPLPTDSDVVASGDLDGDGVLDLASVTSAGLEVLIGVGDGSFVLPGSVVGPGLDPREVTIADFTDDGIPDVAACGFLNGAAIQVWTGLGGGAFAAGFQAQLGPGTSSSLALDSGDLNGDGHVDLVVAYQDVPSFFVFNGFLGVFLGDGLGGFQAPGDTQLLGIASDVVLADLNGDGFDDAVAAASLDSRLLVLPSDGGGGFGAPAEYVTPAPRELVVTDLGFDGQPDVVVGSSIFVQGTTPIDVYPVQPGGILGTPTRFGAGEALDHLTAGDVDGDGRTDLVVNGSASRVLVLRGDDVGGFLAPESYTGYGRTLLADFNADGRLDRLDSAGNQLRVTPGLNAPVAGIASYGNGTPGCDGLSTLSANQSPRVPAPGFGLTATSGPSSATGVFYLFDAPSSVGFQLLDLQVLVDLAGLTVFTAPIPIRSDVAGTAFGPLPIPSKPNLIGLSISAQAFWPWSPLSACDPSSLGFSSSRGLTLTFQP